MKNPLTAPGRVLDVAMEAYAITVVASLAGSIGAFMVKRGRELEQSRREEDSRLGQIAFLADHRPSRAGVRAPEMSACVRHCSQIANRSGLL